MSKMILALTIVHVVISVILVIAVLMQHGKQQGLSGAIAGGAETFFGKNKGRTIDAILKKVTAVVAILFVASSLTLAAVSVNEYNKANEVVAPGAETLPIDLGEVTTGDTTTTESDATATTEGDAATVEGEATATTEGEATATEAE